MEELPSPIMSLCASLAAGNPVHFLAENTQMWPRFSPTGPRTKYPEKPGYSHSLKSQASLKEKQRPTEQDGIDERWQCEIYLTVFREAIKKRFILEKFSQICEPTYPPQVFFWDLGKRKVKFRSKEAIFWVIWGGLRGLDLVLESATHPYLEKLSPKK